MIHINEVTLVGRIACEPVFDKTPNGTDTCKFILETVDRIQNTTRMSIHQISCIGKLCDNVARFARLNSNVLVRGRLEYWTDKTSSVRMVDVRASYVEIDNS